MPLPVAHSLVAASVLAASRSQFSLSRDGRALLVAALIGIAPDFDLFLSWVLGYSLKLHGSFTHSILFAIALGALGAWLARQVGWRGWIVFSLAALSHGLLDAALKKEFGGAQLLWPFSQHRYTLGVVSYFKYYPSPGHDPWGPLLLRAAEISLYELLIFGPLFLAIVLWQKWRSRAVSVLPAR